MYFLDLTRFEFNEKVIFHILFVIFIFHFLIALDLGVTTLVVLCS
jgi:hypothetical protein